MFRPVAAHEVPDVWDFVEPGINRIIDKCGSHKHAWTARDIRRHLRDGRGVLFLVHSWQQESIDVGPPELPMLDRFLSKSFGFIIVEKCQEPISREPYLNAWLAWSQPRYFSVIRRKLIAWLDAMRDYERCEWWEFTSPRDEWIPVMQKVCEKPMKTWRRYR